MHGHEPSGHPLRCIAKNESLYVSLWGEGQEFPLGCVWNAVLHNAVVIIV